MGLAVGKWCFAHVAAKGPDEGDDVGKTRAPGDLAHRRLTRGKKLPRALQTPLDDQLMRALSEVAPEEIVQVGGAVADHRRELLHAECVSVALLDDSERQTQRV